jgi:multidrug resistance efflux pump
LLLAKHRAEQRLKIAQQELDKIKIESTQEMRLKEEENRLSGRQRDLASVAELNRLKLSEAEAKLNLALLSVKRLEQKLKATQIHSPVDGKVISIQVQHSTVTLRILAQSSFSAVEAELSQIDSSESIEDERE